MFNSKFQKVYRQIIAEQMENMPVINNHLKYNLKEDYIVFIFECEERGLSKEEYADFQDCNYKQLYEEFMQRKPLPWSANLELFVQRFQQMQHNTQFTEDQIERPLVEAVLKYFAFLQDNNINEVTRYIPATGGAYYVLVYIPQDLNIITNFLNSILPILSMYNNTIISNSTISNILSIIKTYFKTKNRQLLNNINIPEIERTCKDDVYLENQFEGNPRIYL